MSVNTFTELYINELKDIYSAEQQVLTSMPKIIDAASCEELKRSITEHMEQTKEQVARLHSIFEDLQDKPTGHPCKAMAGLIEEAEDLIEEVASGPLLDAALIAEIQKVEHYEIASYGTARALAEMLGKQRHVDLLQQTLNEERGADLKLTQLAMASVNRPASDIEEHANPRGVGPDGKPHQSLGRSEDQMARDRGEGQGLGLAEGRGQENDPHRRLVPDPEDLIEPVRQVW